MYIHVHIYIYIYTIILYIYIYIYFIYTTQYTNSGIRVRVFTGVNPTAQTLFKLYKSARYVNCGRVFIVVMKK